MLSVIYYGQAQKQFHGRIFQLFYGEKAVLQANLGGDSRCGGFGEFFEFFLFFS
jgi:hypothetical protein